MEDLPQPLALRNGQLQCQPSRNLPEWNDAAGRVLNGHEMVGGEVAGAHPALIRGGPRQETPRKLVCTPSGDPPRCRIMTEEAFATAPQQEDVVGAPEIAKHTKGDELSRLQRRGERAHEQGPRVLFQSSFSTIFIVANMFLGRQPKEAEEEITVE